jgi:hypothetical protein
MKKNIWKLFVIIALAAVIGLGLTGCHSDSKPTIKLDDGGGSGGRPTIKLEDKGNNTFTLALSGTTWNSEYNDAALAFQILNVGNYIETGTVAFFYAVENMTRESDTVVTITIPKSEAGTGTVKLKVWDGQHAEIYGTAGSVLAAMVEAGELDVASDSGTANYTSGDGAEYPYAEYFPENGFIKPHIKIYFNKKITNSYIWENDTAFSVTVGGVSQSLKKDIELVPPYYDTVGLWFSNNLPNSGVIKVSYDGSGVLAGKLDPFSDMTVSQK